MSTIRAGMTQAMFRPGLRISGNATRSANYLWPTVSRGKDHEREVGVRRMEWVSARRGQAVGLATRSACFSIALVLNVADLSPHNLARLRTGVRNL